MTEAILTLLYALLFCFLIYKSSFFRLPEIPKFLVVAVFILKILFGLVLWWIYTYYYTDRLKADIYKYYDDSLPLYNLLFEHPIYFLQIIFGIDNGPENFHYIYDQMYNWYILFPTHIYNANHTMIKLNAIIRIFSFGNFNVHTVFFCFFSLLGQIAIYKTFYGYLKDRKWELFVSVFLLPSVLFWGSGVLKEGVILLGLGLFIYALHDLIFNKVSFKMFLLLLLGLAAILTTKVYIMVALFPGIILFILIKYTGYQFLLLKYLAILLSMFAIGYAFSFISYSYNVPYMLSMKQKDFYNTLKGGVYLHRHIGDSKEFVKIYFPASKLYKFKGVERNDTIKIQHADTAYIWDVATYEVSDTIIISPSDSITYRMLEKDTSSGSSIQIPKLEPNYFSIIKNSPAAFLNTLMRPFPLEMDSFFSLIAGIENLLIELSILFFLFFIKIPEQEKRLMALFSFSFVLMLFVLTGLVTPVIGAIVRYKMPALAFLFIALLLISDKHKIHVFLFRNKS